MEILFPPAPDVAPQAKVDRGHGGGSLAEQAGGFELLLTVRTPQKQLAIGLQVEIETAEYAGLSCSGQNIGESALSHFLAHAEVAYVGAQQPAHADCCVTSINEKLEGGMVIFQCS